MSHSSIDFNNKTILITGGAGNIGTNLCNELISRNYEVISSDLFNNAIDNYVRCDVSKIRQLENIFNTFGPFDYVYHLAAEFGRWNGEDYYETLWKSNAVGTKNILRITCKY